MRRLLFLPLLMLLAAIIVSCEEEKHTYVGNVKNPEKTPTMVTENVATFISDSGYTRYHIEAPVWNMYEDAKEPHWTFPRGLALEQYDLQLRPAATMACDSAIFWSQKRLWRLDGNVVMVNVQKDTFVTQQLFWDQTANKLYSDSFMHIVKNRHVIEGYGFVSNQEMTRYTVHRPNAIIPIDGENAPGSRKPASADSSVAPVNPAARPSAPERASRRGDSSFIRPVSADSASH